MRLKGTVSRDFLLLVFFMNQFPPSPRVFHLDRFEIFRKVAEIFASQGAPPVSPPVSTIPVANLPPVSTTPAENFATSFTSICCYRWQTMGLISGCRYLKVNLRAKMCIYVNCTIQRCPNKIIIIFLIEDFFHLPPHRWCT